MLPSCRQVAEQLSEHIDEPLRGFKWFKLKLHLTMCSICRRYGEQINLASKIIAVIDKKIHPNEKLKSDLIVYYRDNHCSREEIKPEQE